MAANRQFHLADGKSEPLCGTRETEPLAVTKEMYLNAPPDRQCSECWSISLRRPSTAR